MDMKKLKDYESEVLDIIETKDWDRANDSNKNLYQYVYRNKDTDENCKIIWEHRKIRTRNFESEVLEIIRTKDWDRTRWSNKSLYQYVYRNRNTDENCKIIWEHINRQRDHKSEVLEIVETKDWDRAKRSKDRNLYRYIKNHKDTDENCKIIWEHRKIRTRNYKSEISDIIRTKDWNRAKKSNDINLYLYIKRYRDTVENCRIIWKHIEAGRGRRSIKRYLLCYFKYGKPTYSSNTNLYNWFTREINKGNQCCIDIRNLITAADIYQDPVALETLYLIKNHLEKEGL